MSTIAILDAIVVSIGNRGVFGHETPCTVSLYQGSTFIKDLDVHLTEPVIMERLTVEVQREET